MKSAAAIAFDYRPSRWLLSAVSLLCVLALVALSLCALNVVLGVVLGAAACAYSALELRRTLLSPARRLAWHTAGHWRIAQAGGHAQVAELQHAVVRGEWIVLRLQRSDGARCAFVLAPDNTDADTRRRLRVRLARAQAEL